MSSAVSFGNIRGSMKMQKRIGVIIRLIIAVFLIIFSIFPVLWIVSASLNPASSLATAKLIPDNWGFDNFQVLLQSEIFPFWTWWWNSIKIASITTILMLFITTTAAYAFSRFRFYARKTMLKTLLLIQVFPNLLALVAIFLMMSQIGETISSMMSQIGVTRDWLGLNTHAGLILVYLGGAMGINIWLMKGYMDTIPRDIDESAMVDGATAWQTFYILILPLLRPILVVIGILSFIGTYGDFILARILLKSSEQYTLMVGLQIYTSGQFSQKWGPFAAGALIGALPIMIIYLALQDQIVGGLTKGSVKG